MTILKNLVGRLNVSYGSASAPLDCSARFTFYRTTMRALPCTVNSGGKRANAGRGWYGWSCKSSGGYGGKSFTQYPPTIAHSYATDQASPERKGFLCGHKLAASQGSGCAGAYIRWMSIAFACTATRQKHLSMFMRQRPPPSTTGAAKLEHMDPPQRHCFKIKPLWRNY